MDASDFSTRYNAGKKEILDTDDFWTRWRAGQKEFCDIDLRHIDLQDADLSSLSFKNSNLSHQSLSFCKFNNANLSKTLLAYADFIYAQLEAADLSNANLHTANLSGANMNDANLSRANLKSAILFGSQLRNANLRHADLTDANLVGADLRGADLSYANLTDTELTDADLMSANIEGTILDENNTHTECQWILAKLGLKLCYGKPWIASNDHSKMWSDESFINLTADNLPALGIFGNKTEEAKKIIKLIDVIWLNNDNQIQAAFEIECTTSIYSGLLRLSDLTKLCDRLDFPLYIVAPKARVKQVQQQLSRPTFQELNFHQKCRWIVIEDLRHKWREMINWASDSNAIKNIANSLD
jgi:Uncharacterized low-complexity proteins